MMKDTLEQQLQQACQGNRRALSALISLAQSDDYVRRAQLHAAWQLMPARDRKPAMKFGFVGAGGVGKSTLINQLGNIVLQQGFRLAVLTIDPTSKKNGGSLLGDAVRMPNIAFHERAFLRTSPGGRASGGVTHGTQMAIELCEYAGYEVILVESIGSGQSEYEIAPLVDMLFWLTVPGAGDDLQAMKQGVLEWVEGIIVTQADQGREAIAKSTQAFFEQGVHMHNSSVKVSCLTALDASQVRDFWISALHDLQTRLVGEDPASTDQLLSARAFEQLWIYREARTRLWPTQSHDTGECQQLCEWLEAQSLVSSEWQTSFLRAFVRLFGMDAAVLNWGGQSFRFGSALTSKELGHLGLYLPSTPVCVSDNLFEWGVGQKIQLQALVFVPLSLVCYDIQSLDFANILNQGYQYVLGYRFLADDPRASHPTALPSVNDSQFWSRMLRCIFYDAQVDQFQLMIRRQNHSPVDPVTGLHNRESFVQNFERLLVENPTSGYLFALDIVDFRAINDALGLESGDQVLRYVSYVLQQYLHEPRIIARFGGDEFFFYTTLPEAMNHVQFSETLREALQQVSEHRPKWLSRLEIHLGCLPLKHVLESGSTNTFSAAEMIRAAGAALFAAKSLNDVTVFTYEAALQAKARTGFKVKNELYQAVEENQFSYCAQPLYNASAGRFIGAELLLRWNHPYRGMLAAGEFIDSAARLGIVRQNDLNLIFKNLKPVIEIGRRHHVVFHLNLSAELFCDRDIIDFAIELELKGALPHLHFEITEHTFIDRMVLLKQFMARVKAGGSQVWLDDFGVGYSGLRYLDRLDIDGIKIDQSFVSRIRHPKTRTLFNGIMTLAQGMNLEVLAEGVEFDWQAKALTKLGCHLHQGHYYSDGIALQAFESLLLKRAVDESL